ncbi:MAG: hypothetical protein ACRDSF_00440 [Pseudonocardiaceae bacterium]
MSVSLAGNLPADDRNGLSALAGCLVDDPQAVHVVVALVDCVKITTKVESGDVVPTARVRAIEPIGAHADAGEMRRLLRRAYERRTGKVELPLELERELDALAGDEDGDSD